MSKKRICLDSGHYGSTYNAGAVKGYYESAIVWKLTMLEKEYLERMGIDVVLTRTNIDDNPELTDRGRLAKGCDLFVSNHTNACDDPSVNRVSVIYLVDNNKTTIDEKSKEFATKIAPVVKKTMGVSTSKTYSKLATVDRDKDGKTNDNYYGVLHGAFMAGVPGVIIEHSFHTNPETCKWLMNDDNLKKLAKDCAEFMAKYVGVTGEVTNTTPAKTETVTSTKTDVKVGDVVTIKSGATYYSGKDVPSWVEKKQWIVREVKGDRVVIDKSADGSNAINSPINAKFLTVVKTSTTKKEVKASGYAQKFDEKVAGTYKTLENLNLRNGAGVNNRALCVIPKDTKVKCYGYYSVISGANWLSVQVTLGDVTYTGFCNAKYLKK